MMLKKMIESQRYSFHQGFDDWEEAIHAACAPLVEQKAVEKEYAEYIIANVKEFGPYIIIAPKIAIPHAQEGKGVNETSICLMKTQEPVKFGEEEGEEAQLFFVLASTDNNIHIDNLSHMVELLSDEKIVEGLLQAKSVEDLKKLA